MTTSFKPAFRRSFGTLVKVGIWFVCIIIAVMLLPAVLRLFGHSASGSFSMFGAAMAITMLITGITSTRENIRTCIQLGVSRRTSFIAQIVAMIALIAILSVIGEILTYLGKLAVQNIGSLFFSDIYQLFYTESSIPQLTFSQHILSALLNMSFSVSAFMFGMFFAILFWRLNKLGKIIAAAAMFLFFNLGLNSALFLNVSGITTACKAFLNAAAESPVPWFILLAAISVVFAAVEYLIMRRVNITGPK